MNKTIHTGPALIQLRALGLVLEAETGAEEAKRCSSSWVARPTAQQHQVLGRKVLPPRPVPPWPLTPAPEAGEKAVCRQGQPDADNIAVPFPAFPASSPNAEHGMRVKNKTQFLSSQ